MGVVEIDDGLSGLEGSAEIGNGSTLVSFSPAPLPSTAFSSYVEIDMSNAFRGGFSVSVNLGLSLDDGPGSLMSGSLSMTSQLSNASSSLSSRSPSLDDFTLSLPFPLENNFLDPVLSRPPVWGESNPNDVVLLPNVRKCPKDSESVDAAEPTE